VIQAGQQIIPAGAALSVYWTPPGPVAAAFEADTSFNPLIVGPVGSGKTTTSVKKIVGLAQRLPGALENVNGKLRRVKSCRVAVVASTHRILWKNLLPSYWKVFPKDWGKWTGGEGEPAEHKFQMRAGIDAHGVEIILQIQVDFIGVADRSLDDITHGLELTGCYIYEVDTLPKDTISKFAGRLGRWPKMPTGEEQDLLPRQVWGDCNAFDPDHWLYAECFDEKPAGREVYVQPSALSDQAENIHNVGRGYYTQQCQLLKPWEIARLIENRFVPDRPGFVVYSDWNPLLHTAKETIKPVRTLPLLIGVDQGHKAAAAINQRLAKRVWRTLAELTTPADEITTAGKFAEDLADLIVQVFGPGMNVLAVLDPAAKARMSTEQALSWIEEFAGAFPWPCMPAISNKMTGENGGLETMRQVLTYMPKGFPAYQVDPRCKVLLKGFNGAYRLKPVPGQSGVASGEVDKKAIEANVHDANRYVIDTIERQDHLMGDAGASRVALIAAGGNNPPAQVQQIF
jgi:hypothetical protein